VIEQLKVIGQRWGYPYRIGVGDLSRQNGGPFPPHANHTDGLAADLRYVHKKGEHTVDLSKCRSTRCRSTYFDQEATERLIALLEEAGATRVITYPSPKLAGTIVEPMWSHGNHMHVDFPDRFPVSAPAEASDGGALTD
jgi:murein endopeptidase